MPWGLPEDFYCPGACTPQSQADYEKKGRGVPPRLLVYPAQLVTAPSHAFAVIDGALCRLGRFGGRAVWHVPIASAVVEFRRGPMRTYVREHPYGLLPGLSNLYCLDGAHRLQWMAEWPDAAGSCTAIGDEIDGVLVATSAAGVEVRLDAATGRLIGYAQPVAATG